MNHCRFPTLPAPYDRALHEAITFILERCEPLGIIASGTIIRGNPGPNGDFDLYVIHARPQRQRIQRRFLGVPAEIFVNPPSMIERYFEDEQRNARPITAHMLATGFVILDRDPVIEQLRERARALLTQPPNPGHTHLLWQRYLIGSQYEDALDMIAERPHAAQMILSLAIHAMLQYRFWIANRHLPRDKDLLETLRDVDPALADLGRAFYTTADLSQRLTLAEQIADQTIQVRGFFEWESDPEAV